MPNVVFLLVGVGLGAVTALIVIREYFIEERRNRYAEKEYKKQKEDETIKAIRAELVFRAKNAADEVFKKLDERIKTLETIKAAPVVAGVSANVVESLVSDVKELCIKYINGRIETLERGLKSELVRMLIKFTQEIVAIRGNNNAQADKKSKDFRRTRKASNSKRPGRSAKGD